MSYELDDDTRIDRRDDDAPGRYRAEVSGRYSIGNVPNGGYVLALALAAARRALPHPDPIVATAYYLAPSEEGSAELEVDVIKRGRRFATAEVRLSQGGRERVRVLTTFGVLDDALGGAQARFTDGAPPTLPPVADCVTERPVGAMATADNPAPVDSRRPSAFSSSTIGARFDMALDPATTGFLRGERSAHAEIRGYVRFADGRPIDVASLALFADAFPPPVFHVVDMGWVPTLELSVQFRARPRPDGYLRARFATRFVGAGLLEEDGELWDESGTLVALSRQTATLPR